ncbi:MAG: hypothetical protein LBB48_09690, partial [Treponema sp.]|nr:hypothetical protein [Treponema sp.]
GGGGGGVYVNSSGTFTKQSGGVIYGSDANSNALKNSAGKGDDAYGHAVYVDSRRKHNGTVGVGVTLDSSIPGSLGGWEALTSGIGGITYSSVSGGAWTVESDGRRKSPRISGGGLTKARISFTCNSTAAYITIRLDVSSESGRDYAFISQVDNADATSGSGYYYDNYSSSVISGENSVLVTIPVSSPGGHFIDIGYSKDQDMNFGSDCAWFKIIE